MRRHAHHVKVRHEFEVKKREEEAGRSKVDLSPAGFAGTLKRGGLCRRISQRRSRALRLAIESAPNELLEAHADNLEPPTASPTGRSHPEAFSVAFNGHDFHTVPVGSSIL
jgi:hypothetical protein